MKDAQLLHASVLSVDSTAVVLLAMCYSANASQHVTLQLLSETWQDVT